MYGRPTKLIAYPQISRVGHAAQMPTLATGTNVPMLEEQTLAPGGDVVLASAKVAQPGLVGTVKAKLDRLPPWVLYAAVGFGLIYASRRMR